jgi:2-hydroxychromene-2-carboxylate isomerase
MKTIEFFFDVGSPTAYLAYTQLPQIAQRCGAEIVYRPMLLGGVFKATGNQSPVTVAAKGKWMLADLQLWAARYGVQLQFNPHFPINTLPLMRGAVAMQAIGSERLQTYLNVIMAAMWQHKKNMGDPVVIAEVLNSAGIDSDHFTTQISHDDVKARLVQNTEEAVFRGVFGAPTCFVGKQMFFGQDRLMFVEEALLKI